jgi:hypothetical protein
MEREHHETKQRKTKQPPWKTRTHRKNTPPAPARGEGDAMPWLQTHHQFFVICLVTSSIAPTVDGMHSTVNEDLALERQLNIVNKSHIKSTHVFIYTHIWIFYCLNLISIFNNSIFVDFGDFSRQCQDI